MPDINLNTRPDGGNQPEELTVTTGPTRAEAIFRLQIGLAGLVAMLMMIGLANIIMDRAKESDATTVPEAASTAAPVKTPPVPGSDPLADAGVIPAAKSDGTGGKSNQNGDPKQ